MASRLHIVIAVVVVTALGIAAKNHSGPAQWWVNDWGPASVAYVVFFMLLAFLVFPRRSAATPIAIAVVLATCFVEVLQLWHPEWLEDLRSSVLGATLLGTSFSLWDFPAYIVGGIVGWFFLRWLATDRGSDN
jgi:hypothetical protein